MRLNADMEMVLLSGKNLKVQGNAVCLNSKTECYLRVVREQGEWSLLVESQRHPFSQRRLQITGTDLHVGTKRVPSEIFLIQKKNGIDVIGSLSLDDYLVGVVSSEMPANWPLETLKAQAIAARSYTLSTIQERKRNEFHLESSVLDQVFRAPSKAQQKKYQQVQKAIRETSGLVLTNSKRLPIKAFYHSDCGGETKSAIDVWKMSQSYGQAKDPFCEDRKKSQWSFRVSQRTLQEKLSGFFQKPLQWWPRFDWSESVIKYHPTVSAEMSGQRLLVAANDLRKLLGFENLKSATFVVKQLEDEVEFRGQGFGHGVGLCQWGSWELGKQGKSFKEILKHYYPKAFLRRL